MKSYAAFGLIILSMAVTALAGPLVLYQAQQIAAIMKSDDFLHTFQTLESIDTITLKDARSLQFEISSHYKESITRKRYSCSRTVTMAADTSDEWNPKYSVVQ